ncbi:hypothetical protein ACIPPS_30065 [Streptomyces sp. NPDC090127]|uniref:COG1470 family protein n=1 Tax=Streptomyces sp. NPDC090127 TaxID=3365953 RepID=UPI0038003AE0
MRGAWAGTATAVAALLGAVAAAPASTPAPGWTAGAAGAGGTGGAAQGRPYVYLEGAAGSVLQDTLSVSNPGARPLTVRLDGQGAPLAFAARTVTVPARTRADVPFAVTVTADTPPGDHRGTVTVTADGRAVRVPVHLRVSGPILAALTVENVRLDASGTLRYTLVNRGSTVLVPRLSVRAEGAFGTVLDRPSRALALTLRPGERATRTEPWPDPPALDAVAVHVRATAPGATAAEARAERVFVSTGAAVAGAGALLTVVAAAAATLRRRRDRATEETEIPVGQPQLVDVTAGADR